MLNERILKVMKQILEIDVNSMEQEISIQTVENWDSLRHMNLIVALEEEFNIEFNEDQIMGMVSFNDIVTVVRNMI